MAARLPVSMVRRPQVASFLYQVSSFRCQAATARLRLPRPEQSGRTKRARLGRRVTSPALFPAPRGSARRARIFGQRAKPASAMLPPLRTDNVCPMGSVANSLGRGGTAPALFLRPAPQDAPGRRGAARGISDAGGLIFWQHARPEPAMLVWS